MKKFLIVCLVLVIALTTVVTPRGIYADDGEEETGPVAQIIKAVMEYNRSQNQFINTEKEFLKKPVIIDPEWWKLVEFDLRAEEGDLQVRNPTTTSLL